MSRMHRAKPVKSRALRDSNFRGTHLAPPMNHYGEKLKSLREKRGLSVNHLAAVLGVKPAILVKAEATGEFSIALVPRLAKELKVSVQKFVRMSGRKKASELAAKTPTIVVGAPPKKKKKKPNRAAAPKKVVLKSAVQRFDGEDEQGLPVPEKKRGRPKKVSVFLKALEAAETAGLPPKKRGRPKKVAVAQPARPDDDAVAAELASLN